MGGGLAIDHHAAVGDLAARALGAELDEELRRQQHRHAVDARVAHHPERHCFFAAELRQLVRLSRSQLRLDRPRVRRGVRVLEDRDDVGGREGEAAEEAVGVFDGNTAMDEAEFGVVERTAAPGVRKKRIAARKSQSAWQDLPSYLHVRLPQLLPYAGLRSAYRTRGYAALTVRVR